jgi:hypothetical protein
MSLGKKLNTGDTFESSTKRQIKQPVYSGLGWKATLRVKKIGYRGYFQYKKRQYYGEIVRLLETRTGVYKASICSTTYKNGVRYWQFTYLIKVIES